MQTTSRFLFGLILALGLPLAAIAQHQDDPFEDDPLFSKPVREWFSPESITREVRRTRDRIVRLSGVDHPYNDLTGYGQIPGFVGMSSVKPMIRFNRVDGVHLGISSQQEEWGNHQDEYDFGSIYGGIGYSFGREEWLYTIGAERFFGPSQRFKAGVEYHRITDSDDGFRTGWSENAITSFFGGWDQMDFYGRQGAAIFTHFKPAKWVELTAAYRSDDVHNLSRNTRYTMFGKKSTYRDNEPILIGQDSARVNHLVFGVQLNPDDRFLTERFQISADVLGQFGEAFGDLGSDYGYDRIEAEVRSLFVIDRGATLRIRLRAGEVVGNPTRNAFFRLGGMGTMRAMPFKSMEGNSMVLANAELWLGEHERHSYHEWVDAVFDLDEINFMVFLDAGWTDPDPLVSTKMFDSLSNFAVNRMETNVGLGINLSALRFELAWHTKDLAGPPALWVRFNPTF